MDRSVDSIGSCSLDVDADSSDISDTSGSLNFPTPLSVKDITREFTANIRERCSARNSTAVVDPVTGQVRMVLTQPTANNNNNSGADVGGALNAPSALAPTPQNESQTDKKPSYLNLACCVNGYSNLTTYDSKIRQDINKSREVSPIRPSSNSLHYCKKNNALAPPVLHTMPNVGLTNGGSGAGGAAGVSAPHTKQPTATAASIRYMESNNNNGNNGNTLAEHTKSIFGLETGTCNEERRHTSFIQQRVERLYGPGALAQGFYSPKKIRSSHVIRTPNQLSAEEPATTELSRKFQELSPSKDYSEFRKKIDAQSVPQVTRNVLSATAIEHSENNSIDLPVLRHLSQEFRAQLPSISPKRNLARASPSRDANANGNANENANDCPSTAVPNGIASKPLDNTELDKTDEEPDEVDNRAIVNLAVQQDMQVNVPVSVSVSKETLQSQGNELIIKSAHSIAENKALSNNTTQLPTQPATPANTTPRNGSLEKDGNYFLNLLKSEQARLLSLASDAEKYIEDLTNNPEISEDTFGFLRAASGKARLLVSQKMKQFEGLCHNNLNGSPKDKFPTTVDDLQGFWDMVYLQIDHIDSIFADIEVLKNNDWKKPNSTSNVSSTSASNTSNKTQKITKTANAKSKMSSITSNKNNNANANTEKSAAALKREAQRKQLLEMKRKNRMAMSAATNVDNAAVACKTNGDDSIEIYVEEKSS